MYTYSRLSLSTSLRIFLRSLCVLFNYMFPQIVLPKWPSVQAPPMGPREPTSGHKPKEYLLSFLHQPSTANCSRTPTLHIKVLNGQTQYMPPQLLVYILCAPHISHADDDISHLSLPTFGFYMFSALWSMIFCQTLIG